MKSQQQRNLHLLLEQVTDLFTLIQPPPKEVTHTHYNNFQQIQEDSMGMQQFH